MCTLFTKLVLAALLPAHALTSAAHADTIGGEEITVGVRSDARPFIWQDQNTKGYNGFFWDICTEAVQRAGYRLKAVNVNTGKRAEFLRAGSGDYDLLCDPTTITLKRMQNFAYNGGVPYLEFSPIVFVANGSYVKQQLRAIAPKAAGDLPKGAGKPTCDEIVTWLGQVEGEKPEEWKWWPAPNLQAADSEKTPDPATDGFLGWFKRKFKLTLSRSPQGEDEQTKTFEIWGYVEGSTSQLTAERQAKTGSKDGLMICPRAMNSHDDAAKAFCSRSLARYYGDVDMIRAALAGYSEDTATRCAADFTPAAAGSYEPYAFVVSSRHFPDFPERISLALYGMFEDGTVERLFTGHFPGTQKSQYLGTLFRINSIPAGSEPPSKDPLLACFRCPVGIGLSSL
ncbi:hypothetical protein ILFOPFJJ_05876 [Ensifer psoraleae]|uniref:transporter substrate-binding domain-containing protein n=1 Tax=Sinorhizobium psoraleae TaxID=520838 RepID=UPI0015691A99|nr:transporter substrate-binding domain-containing protein [Sinorhizobium psoraleae]NRP74953.1 hypothetical protein [Sinorhizobium psoraleae]